MAKVNFLIPRTLISLTKYAIALASTEGLATFSILLENAIASDERTSRPCR